MAKLYWKLTTLSDNTPLCTK